MSLAMRRASSSKPRAVSALRLAASISPASSCMTPSRTLNPSATGAASAVSLYIAAMTALWRASTPGLLNCLSATFGTCTSPRKVTGT
jgi:hypothetical protein